MGLKEINSGRDLPNEINVIIEIPMRGEPVKYEVDKETGALFVDRFMSTAMFYPTNYGYIPNTLSEDGDPVDVLVVTPVPLISGAVIRCRAIGMLKMTDESGIDAKVLAVPVNKLSKMYDGVKTYRDLPQPLLLSIEHFFKHYKDLEEGKWVRVDGWDAAEAAHEEILSSVARYQQHSK
ncbi:inorganic diphosphatase [Legionella oakridgensis]|uniref:Inorganic pyrophosphatase n=2 Tax=Legionella oakridgensis TaxID=29423 RepID=W0BCH7_9GAMM|nr:inorganic diphosphatase [Legionella oakridgensis]AHE68233.1 inorganic pyrophosphatase [Legionella oakridgensis ATCC 33761 = DSM 21215]ETO92316.1 inorganic pyrophosphatase [Legionella oakridgensis RV-2-2007]KTD39572.1 inorganic pyrophosphatase [Legionella oakridgensis]STY21191.1 inorganic pyrophosphatase [Legionella longbeachae]